MIAGAVKYFRFSVEYILHELSYTNLIMLSATIPDYRSDESNEKPVGGKTFGINDNVTVKASDPENKFLIEHIFGTPTKIKRT